MDISVAILNISFFVPDNQVIEKVLKWLEKQSLDLSSKKNW